MIRRAGGAAMRGTVATQLRKFHLWVLRRRRGLSFLPRAAYGTSRARAGAASVRPSRTLTWSAVTRGRAAAVRRRSSDRQSAERVPDRMRREPRQRPAFGLGQLRKLLLRLCDGPSHQPARAAHRIAAGAPATRTPAQRTHRVPLTLERQAARYAYFSCEMWRVQGDAPPAAKLGRH